MDLCLKMAYLLLLTVSEVVNVAVDRASVLLSPRTQEVTVGSPLTLNCSFDVDESTGQVVVEIPNLWHLDSNESQVIVNSSKVPRSLKNPVGANVGRWPWLWVAVGVGGAVLLALAVIGSISYKITSCRTTENPIYENMSPILKSTVPSQSSPRPGSEVNTYKLTSSMDMGTPTTSQEAGTKQKLTL
ncbi:hypothetical protein MATL_G00030170 [Megalops atlanticus]|uniref:Uncharacterized protein n=1 Tax=Megalops atlanticus TaxID=7932 RepID=A0A9D3QEA7_MEGAT|nr:hypothetical protein MATL_G00030170 [Megalops atlanticus]